MQVLFLSQGYAFFLQLPCLKGCLSTLPTRLGQAYHFSQTPSSTPTLNTHTGILTNPSLKGTSHQTSLLRQLSTAGEGSEPQQPLLGFSHGAMQLPQLFQAHSFQRNLAGIVHNQVQVWASKQTELWTEGVDRVRKSKGTSDHEPGWQGPKFSRTSPGPGSILLDCITD